MRVWMHKETGQLVEYCKGWLGEFILYGEVNGGVPWSNDTPGYFEDDERWRPDDFEDLGEL